MRQKYLILQDDNQNQLKIREYAIVGKQPKNQDATILRDDHFSFLCEETYEGKIIVSAISKGLSALIAALRTPNLFPIEPYATKIAESVMALYDSEDDRSAELFFDDIDLVSVVLEG